MAQVAKGALSVETKPEASVSEGASTGRMSLAKRFEGDLVAAGDGEVLTALTPASGSAGSVR